MLPLFSVICEAGQRKHRKMIGQILVLVAVLCHLCLAGNLNARLNNGVGITPALGWNNWNMGGSATSTAANALAAANAFVKLGLRDLGYTYINIDDCWSTMSRNSTGYLVPDPTKWPEGIKPVADQIHAMGLKFGLYGDSGTATCAGFPGSQGYETKDAQTLAQWGVDYWKYDNCNTPSGNSSTRFATMRDALLATGRPILYSLCQWGVDSVWTWGASVGHSWRVGGDITNTWGSISSIAASNAGITSYAAPGGFNDYDMMEIGNGVLTEAEERTHFGLWAICKSPIILGTNLSSISTSSLNVIKNKAIIAINQDSLGKAASTFQPSGQPAPVAGNTLYPYWAGPLSDGVVIGLVAVSGATTLSVNFADVPGLGSGPYSWTELYSGNTGSGSSVSAKLGLHDMAIFKVTATGQTTASVKPSTTLTVSTSTLIRSTTASSSKISSLSSNSMTKSSTATSPTVTATVPQWGQCGGIGYTGSTTCASGYTCHYQNDYYSQCY